MLYAKRTNANAWFVCLTAALFFFFIFIQTTAFNAINQYFQYDFHTTSTQVSLISTCYFIGCVAFIFPAGILLDRFSPKKIIVFWMVVCTVATFFFAVTHSLWVAALARIVIGLAGAFALLACIKIASHWFSSNRMAFVIGVIVTMAMIGGMVSQTPLTVAAKYFGWRQSMMLVGVLGALITLMILILVRDNPPEAKAKIAEHKEHLSSLGFWNTLGKVLLNSQNWFAGLYTSLLNLPIFLLGGFGGIIYLSQVHHLSTVVASYATSALFLGMIIGSPTLGWFSDYIKRRRRPMIIGAMVSLIIMLFIMYVPNQPAWSYLITFFLLGFAIAAQVIGYPLVGESNHGALTGTATAVASTLIMAGGFTQTLFGWLMHLHGGYTIINNTPIYPASAYTWPMLIMPIAMVIGLVMAILVKETHCKPLKKS